MHIANHNPSELVEHPADEPMIYVSRDGRPEGPFSLTTIRMQIEAGVLCHHDLCWRLGRADWKPIQTLGLTSASTASKLASTLLLAWHKTLFIARKILTPFHWTTPKYWLLKIHKAECLALASKNLPSTYDPIGDEILRRSRVIVTSTPDQTDSLPHINAISDIAGRLDEAVDERRRLAIGTAEMAAYTSFDVASGFAAIDKNVFEGISHLRSEQINTVSDLSKVLKGYDHNMWSGLSHGALIKVQGHIGESVVAQHLQSAGLKVDWPETSNNQGWDLAINGQHLDVKAVVKDVSSSTIYSHFAGHPDVPVVVAGDALHIPSDAIHFNSETGTGFDAFAKAMEHGGNHEVYVDDALSNVDLHDHVQHATSTALGSPNVAHHHFPFVTLVLSGCKEMSLLFHDKTDPVTALKHVSLDTAGTGIGGIAGAKVGALIGSFLGPIGAGLGAIVGGIGGAITARSFTNNIKHQDFEASKHSYEAAAEQLRIQLHEEEESAKTQLATLRNSSQNSLTAEAQGIKETLDIRIAELQQWSDSGRFVHRSEGLVLVNDALDQVKAIVACLKSRSVAHGIWRRWVWPDLPTLADETALRFLRRVEGKLKELKLRLGAGEAIPRNELLSVLGMAGVIRPEVMSYLDAFYAVQSARQRQLQVNVQSQMADLMERRAQAVRALNETVEALAASIWAKLAPLIAA